MNNNNNNNNNIPEDVLVRARRMRDQIADDEKVSKTTYKIDGDISSVPATEGCIVSKTALNKKHVALTPAAMVLLQWWEQGDQVLTANLDHELMTQLSLKVVRSPGEAKKLNKKADKDEKKGLGFKELSKSKACINCENATKQAYTFNMTTADGAKVKPKPYCHRKDCREARDEYAQAHGRPSPSPMAARAAASPSLAPASPSPKKSIAQMSAVELLDEALAQPVGPVRDAVMKLYEESLERSGDAMDVSTAHQGDEIYESDASSAARKRKGKKSKK